MKKCLISVLLIICILLAMPNSVSQASQMPCFTGVNDTLLSLRDATMPAYFGTTLYVPAGTFTEFGISSGTSASQDNLIVYRTSDNLRLTFFISLDIAMSQDGSTYENVSVNTIDGLYFLPLDFICEFFGLTYSLLSNDPVSVLRIKNSDAVYNDRTFLGHYKNQIEKEYKAYNTPATTPPPAVTAPPLETPVIRDYSDVTVYLSFYGVTGEYVQTILGTLSDYSITACFFLSVSDIADNPALVRQISGEKHMVGIWLDRADYEAYLSASKLLFEAAKLVTPLVASDEEIADDVISMCDEYGLLYRKASIRPSDTGSATTLASYLSTAPYTLEDLRFSCTQNTTRILSAIIRYLNTYNYTVSMITETSPLL